MNFDPDSFDEEQKQFLAYIVDDFGGPTSTRNVLSILEQALYELNPDWEVNPTSLSPELRKDIEVCMAALHYAKVQSLAKAS
jgi:hypothetical protein